MLGINNNETVIFLGDSVTDCGRRMPEGEGSMGSGAYGGGYPNFFVSMFRVMHPDFKVRFINKGISGNQTVHVLERLQRDVLDLNPDVVTLLIGINDVWRFFDEPQMNTGVSESAYEENMREIIERITAKTKRLLIMTPFIIDTNKDEPMRVMMDRYGEICKKLAKEYSLELVDLQALFDGLMKKGVYSYELSGDRIHPTQPGHAAIALSLMKAFGENVAL